MSDCLTNNWWETSAFHGSNATNDGWEDLDGDLEMFLAIEELLIARNGFRRPRHNLERRQLELHEVGLMWIT